MSEDAIAALFFIAILIFVLFILLYSSADGMVEPLGW